MTADVLVAGGGLAGSVAAARLAARGQRVVLLEKTQEAHDTVCGEFLSVESLHYLQGAGVGVAALGGVPIRTVRLVRGTAVIEKPLPFPAMSLTRRRLDEALLQRAVQAGVQVQRGCAVDRLAPHAGGWTAHLRGGGIHCAPAAVLATGKHDLRGLPRPAGAQADLVAFKMYYRLHPRQQAGLGSAVELLLFPGGYAGLQPVEGGAANLCMLIRREQLQRCGSGWGGALDHMLRHSPHLQQRLVGAEPLLSTALAAARIPYGHVQRAAEPGLWRVGDQAAVIPSFCGDGMAIALHSAATLADALLRGHSSRQYQRQLHRQLQRRIRVATWLSQLLIAAPAAAAGAMQVVPSLLPMVASFTRIPGARLLPAQSLSA